MVSRISTFPFTVLDTRRLKADEREDYEERAAILEFDGGFSRDEAERRAFEIILLKRKGQMVFWK
jgi:hypothetical protein